MFSLAEKVWQVLSPYVVANLWQPADIKVAKATVQIQCIICFISQRFILCRHIPSLTMQWFSFNMWPKWIVDSFCIGPFGFIPLIVGFWVRTVANAQFTYKCTLCIPISNFSKDELNCCIAGKNIPPLFSILFPVILKYFRAVILCSALTINSPPQTQYH